MKPYNLIKLEELAEGDKDFMAVMVETFLEEIPSDLEQMVAGVLDNDRAKAHEFAHKMKPSLDLFGSPARPVIYDIEVWGKKNLPGDMRDEMIQAQQQVEETLQALRVDFPQA